MTPGFAIAHPVRLDGLGRLASASRPEHLEQMMRLALLTAPGERVNRPEFGAGLARLIFEGGDGASAAARLELRAYLQRLFAGQLSIEELLLDRDDDAFRIAVAYQAVNDDERRVVHWRFDSAELSPPSSSHTAAFTSAETESDTALAALDHTPLPWIDYLARDYDSFRSAMLERLTALTPQWTERNPADPGVALVEALAYAADYLSYKQDAIGAEAHLATAQLRPSVSRHARLRDERLLEGANARVWVHVAIEGERRFRLPVGTRLLTRVGDIGAAISSKWREMGPCLDRAPDVFMTLYEIELATHRNIMAFVAPAGRSVIAAGATSATLAGHPDGLSAGDVIILEMPGQPLVGGTFARQPVRLIAPPEQAHDALGRPVTHIRWHDDDRLLFDLPVATDLDGSPRGDTAIARGNVVLADQGDAGVIMLPPVGPEPYRPHLEIDNLVWSVPFDPSLARDRSAAAALEQDQRRSVAAIMLEEHHEDARPTGRHWHNRVDLLGSDRFAADFVAERHREGALLRFGSGREGGERPRTRTRFLARYRRTAHRPTAIGPGAIAHLVTDHMALRAAIRSVTNPLASTAPQPRQTVEEGRRLITARAAHGGAPDPAAAVDTWLRARDDVADAVVRRQRTDHRDVIACRVLPAGLSPLLDPQDVRRLSAHLQRLVPTGVGVDVRGPDLMPLEVDLAITLSPHVGEPRVRADISRILGDGEDGLFGPGRRTIGGSLSLADLRDAIAGIAGIVAVDVRALRALGGGDAVQSGQVHCPAFSLIVGPVSSSSPARGDLRLAFRRAPQT